VGGPVKVQELIGRLEGGKIPGLLVLHGPERWFVGRIAGTVREAHLEGEDGVETFEGPRRPGDPEGTPLTDLLEEARTIPMFASRKVLLYRVAALAKEDVDRLVEYAKAPSSATRLIVYAYEGLKAGPAGRLARAGAGVGDCGRLYETPRAGRAPHTAQLCQWVLGRAREIGARLDDRAALLLCGLVGNDLGALDAALAVLAVGGEPIAEQTVRSLVGGGRGFDAFAFGEAIYEGDPGRAYQIARNAFREGLEEKKGRWNRAPAFVAARLLWSVHYRLAQVYAVRLALDEGLSAQEAVGSLGGKPHPAKMRAAEQAGRFTTEGLREHFVSLTRAEGDLRSSLPAPVVIDGLVDALAGGGRG
jgi:DNA polymerase III delta subunit